MKLLLIAFLLLSVVLTLACVTRERGQIAISAKAIDQRTTNAELSESTRPIDINTAPANELETLPGIGKSLAARIIEHRDKYGPFRRPEHLIIVRGISDKRFRTIRDLITAN